MNWSIFPHPSVMGNPTSYFRLSARYMLSPSKIAGGLPSAVGWMAARNSSVVASVESVTNPLRGILGRLPPLAPSPSGFDSAAEAEAGAQPILLDIVIAAISEARGGPLSQSRRGEVFLPTPSPLSTFSNLSFPLVITAVSRFPFFRLALVIFPDRSWHALHPPSDRA